MRRFAPIASACTLFFLTTIAYSQQIDVAVGANTLLTSKNNTSSLAFVPPREAGGTYPSVSADILLRKRIGLNLETSWRVKQANYNGSEKYRPILTDVNALFQPKVGKNLGLDLMGGLGIASNRFYLPGNTPCTGGASPCYTSSNHLMEHLSGGVRYYAWHNFFVRPEIHYYHVQNNTGFRSGNLFRVGASIGYTLDRH